jgi:hypothetical protein
LKTTHWTGCANARQRSGERRPKKRRRKKNARRRRRKKQQRKKGAGNNNVVDTNMCTGTKLRSRKVVS